MEFKAFDKRIYLSSPTMHGEEIEYVTEAYNTNWMSTVGKNINEDAINLDESLFHNFIKIVVLLCFNALLVKVFSLL